MKKQIALTATLLAGCLIAGLRYTVHANPQAVDAVSAASLTVAAAQVTDTSAVINYSRDKYDYGSRTLCYAIAPAAPSTCLKPITASGNSGSIPLHPLKRGTSYNYSIKAVDTQGGERPYTSTGAFTTTGSATSIRFNLVNGITRVPGLVVDVNGRVVNAIHTAPSPHLVIPNR